MTGPKYPEGTPEYAAYRAALAVELEKFANGKDPYPYDMTLRDALPSPDLARNGAPTMANPTYSYTSDEDRLTAFIAEHITTRHTVETADRYTLVCLSCSRIVKVDDGHAADVLRKNRPGR